MAAALPVLVFIGWEVYRNAQLCGGRFTYPLDDAYIHLAMAKNWLRYGVVGANSPIFHPLATSPLYTGLVTALTALHPWEYWMLALNLLGGFGVMIAAYRLLTISLRLLPLAALFVCWAAAFLSPLHILIVGGMEHVYQILFLLLFLHEALAPDRTGRYLGGALCLWAFLASATRPECLFVIGPILLFKNTESQSRKGTSALVAFAALLPWLIYGAVNLRTGHHFLPDSMLLKSGDDLDAVRFGTIQYLLYWLNRKMILLQSTPVLGWMVWVMAGLLLARLVFNRDADSPKPPVLLMSGLLSAILLHALFARWGWVYRYENYLIFLGMLAGGGLLLEGSKSVNRVISKTVVLAAPLVLIGLFLIWRTGFRLADTYRAGTWGGQNIHRHHRFMAGFVNRYYYGQTLLVHDIGMLGWQTDSPLLDASGLSGGSVLALQREGRLNAATFDPIRKEAKPVLAFLYPHIARQVKTQDWIECGALVIKPNVLQPSDSVLLYAFDLSEAALLKERFAQAVAADSNPVQVH